MSVFKLYPRDASDDVALDSQFNGAILTLCKHLFPEGFDVSARAPESYEQLIAHLDSGNRMIVWNGGSERTVYGDPQVNYAFRAWHDWCHWRGRFDFSLEGERATCAMQGAQLYAAFGDTPKTHRWRRILDAEIIGQREYFDRHCIFPNDQCNFAESYLATNP